MKQKCIERDMQYANLFTNMMSEGFIYIDTEGKIGLYNDAAKEIFGLVNRSKTYHEQGRLEKGDIVIIANNSMGSDDGDMDGESLELLGLKREDIKKGDPFILISEYKGENILKTVGKEYLDILEIKNDSLGKDITAFIDFKDQIVSIKVEEETHVLDYIDSIGNMVILDGTNKKLKFYQTNGYTARKESINDILKGGEFKEKGRQAQSLNVLGENIFRIHKSESIIEDFYNVAKGRNIRYRDKYEVINGYPTLCTLNPVEDNGKRVGAALKVEDISKIEKVIKEKDIILKELENKSEEIKEKKQFERSFPNIIGEDKKILEAKRLALRGSKTLSNILLIGEPGVGKTLMAKNIHKNSSMSENEFLSLNGKVLNENTIEENLNQIKKGTIYIEEIQSLNLKSQEILLSFIEANEMIDDIRIIISTSSNLDQKTTEEKFNEDLYYKINVFPIYIPSLRERKADIKHLVDHALPIICKRADTESKRVSMEALRLIESYHWPNNIRELINVLERAVNLSLGKNILTEHIILSDSINKPEERVLSLKQQLEKREKMIIQNSLSQHRGDKQKAMEQLSVSQSTFYDKLKKYGIN